MNPVRSHGGFPSSGSTRHNQAVWHSRLLVKIHSEKPTGFVWEERVDPDGLLPSEVIADCAIGERLKRSSLPCNLLSFFRSCRVNRAPVHDTSGRIARLATLSFPAYRINVFSAAKQASKKRNLLLRRRMRGDVAVGYGNNRNCSGTWIFRYRILNAEHRSETGIFCAESVAFLLRRFHTLC